MKKRLNIGLNGREQHVNKQTRPPEKPYEIVSLRVRPIRVDSKAWFETFAEEGSFGLSVSEEDARALADCLYQEVDIVALVARNAAGQIQEGQLQEMYQLQSDEPLSAWDKWWAANCVELDEVEDTERALGRGHDEDDSHHALGRHGS